VNDLDATVKTGLSVKQTSREKKAGSRGLWSYLGPAFVVSVAYMDPGNIGTNISGGSRFAYNLLWVILWSNFAAIFIQTLSAKLGIATGNSLPEHCGKIFSRPVNWGLWFAAVVAAMATDLAEFLGGVLGFGLLFGLPTVCSALLTGIITFGLCHIQKYGQLIVERVITAMVAVIGLAYTWELFIARPAWDQVVYHLAVPHLDADSALVAAGMLGATVMPHVIYLHSHLVQSRRGADVGQRMHHYKMVRIEVFLAMNMAFVVNAAMVIVSAAVFNGNGLEVDSVESAYLTLKPLLGEMAAGAFGLALLVSGLSSSAVGTMAGEVILNGFVGFDLPAGLRRLIVMLPGLLFLLAGANPLTALVASQVVLSFALPAAIIPLLLITGRGEVMGAFKNTRAATAAGWLIAAAIIALNAALLLLILSG